jgi:hypothetical protein
MNDERLENELRGLSVPELPAAWRAEILAAARRAAEPKRAAWPPFWVALRNIFGRHPLTAGALGCLWIVIFVLKEATPVDPTERELLAHVDPHRPVPDFTVMAEQVRLAEAWATYGPEAGPEERQRP